MNKKDYRNIFIILAIIGIYIISCFVNGYSYISEVDYISQHYRIPEYLRLLFYSNGNLFPSFALNLGGGQNIFYLAYHGLLSPITFISYLFPFIKMQYFIVGINIILLFLSIIFFYKWLRKKFDTNVSTMASFIFAFSGPLIYHTHRHIMFNNYMFLLVLGLIFTDLYFDRNKKSPLIFVVFLIIMMSFYYSVVAIVTICIYALYKYLSSVKEININKLIKEALKFIMMMVIPILMACILLLPTIYAIKNGRSDTLSSINLFNTLIPSFRIDNFFYKSYSVGLSSILIYSVINLFLSRDKKNIILGIISSILLLFPFICYALNGFMYIDGKCFIPLLPLLVYIIAIFIDNIKSNKYNYNLLFTITYIVMMIIALTNLNYKYLWLFVIDNACLFTGLMLFKYRKKFVLLEIPVIVFCIMSCLFINSFDRLVSSDKIKKIDSINSSVSIDYDKSYRVSNTSYLLEDVNNVLDSNYFTTSIYSSLENKYYTNFVRNIFKNDIYNKDYHTITNTNNILFNLYMGNKYLINDNKLDNYLEANNYAYSIGHSNNNLMSKKEFDSLEYPYTIDALMRYTIVDKDIDNVYDSKIMEYDKDISLIYSNFSFDKINDNYVFDVTNNGYIKLKLDDEVKDKVLMISFDMNYNEKFDTSITINNIKNTLAYKNWKYHNNNYTFHYVLNNTNDLGISISKGHYEISNIKIYEVDINNYKSIYYDKFNITDTSNDITGNINVTNDGYFSMSIPYDKGFEINVDGNIVDYELVNTSFIGFKIDKGYHDITIKYKPPYAKIGSIISLFGVIIFILFMWRDLDEED